MQISRATHREFSPCRSPPGHDSRTRPHPYLHRRVRRLRCVPAPKYPPATLIQSFAMTTIHHLLEQTPHRLYLPHQLLEFRNLPARQLLPTLRGRSPIPKAKEQISNFIQGETGLPRPLDHRQSVKDGSVVPPLSSNPMRRKKYPNLFVITYRRRLKSNLSRYLRNG